MPYSSNAELPAYVRKLPDVKQRQWRHVINSCLAAGKPEATCFAMANGVARKDVADDDGDDVGERITDPLTLELIEQLYPFTDAAEPPAGSQDPPEDTLGEAEAGVFVLDKLRRAAMPASSFAYVDSHGEKHLPIHDAAHVRNALQRFDQTHFESSAAKRTALAKVHAAAKKFGIEVEGGKAKSVWASILETLGLPAHTNTTGATPTPTMPPAPGVKGGEGEGLCVVKQADGRLRWFARYSNSWEDRDGEIVTEASHKAYLEDVGARGVYPELWLWHTPGTRFGAADWLDFSDGFAYASGLIDVGSEGVVAGLSNKDVGVSHGMLCAQDGKYITRHFTFEISVLPLDRASVWTTDFNVTGLGAKESMMAFTAERRGFLVDMLGEDAVKKLEDNNETVSKQLHDLGIEYKARDEASADANSEALRVIGGQLAELTSNVAGLVGVLSGVKKDVDELKKSPAQKEEETFLSKLEKALANGGAARPTESAANVLPVSTAKELGAPAAVGAGEEDFFVTMHNQAFGALSKMAPASGTAAVVVNND